MAESNKPPLSIQASNQKSDRLDFDHDFGGKIAASMESQEEQSDLEEGEIFSCDSADDETMEELDAKRKLLQSYLNENSSSCTEEGEVDDQNTITIDSDKEPTTVLPISKGKSLFGECKSTKTGKLVISLKTAVIEEKKTITSSSSKSPGNTTGNASEHRKGSQETWERYLDKAGKSKEERDLNTRPKLIEKFGIPVSKDSKRTKLIEEFGIPVSKDSKRTKLTEEFGVPASKDSKSIKEHGKSKDNRSYNKSTGRFEEQRNIKDDRNSNNSNRYFREHEKPKENRNRNRSSEFTEEHGKSKEIRSRNKSAEFTKEHCKPKDNRSRNKSTECTGEQGKPKDNRIFTKSIECPKGHGRLKDTGICIKNKECAETHGSRNRKEIIEKLVGKNSNTNGKGEKQSDLPGSRSKTDEKTPSPKLLGISSSLLAECKKTKGEQFSKVQTKSKPCSNVLSPERRTECEKVPGQIKDTNVIDLTKNEGQKDNLEEMLDNLDEMSSEYSNSDNETTEQISKQKVDSSVKRKRSTELNSPNSTEQLEEKPNKKTRTDEDEESSDSPLDISKPSPVTQEFQIIDDLNAEEISRISEDDEEEELEDGEYTSDELDDNEIYAWLDEGMISRKAVRDTETDEIVPVDEKEKSVLIEKGVDPFEVLPEGWVAVTHNSGMPAYLHKQTRVCTLSKPYFLGPGSVRKHDIPLSAIPCLQYRKEMAKENQNQENVEAKEDQNQENGEAKENQNQDNVETGTQPILVNGETSSPVKENGISEAESTESSEVKDTSADDTTDLDKTLTFDDKVEETINLDTTQTIDGPKPGPPVKIETVEERKKENSLSAEEVLEYCKHIFEFKTVTVKKFKTWKERRKHLNQVRKQSRPALPAHTKLITCSISAEDGTDKPKKKEFVLNPLGKSPVCILHEYAQHTLKVQPRYAFQELENAQNPYCATVMINNVEYGKGYASSKKLAKMNAAKKTLGILIPEMNNLIEEETKEMREDLSFFDEIKIEDPRVFDLCTKTGQPSPYQILLECLKRNYGMGDTHVKTDVKTLKHQKSEYTLSVGKHSVTIVCKNKREGKQRAAQAMLQQLHTHISSLGSLLRLYGQSSGKIFKEKKREEESITELQTHTHSNRPNIALLDKLRTEMNKLESQRSLLTSKGSLLIDNVPGGVTSLDL